MKPFRVPTPRYHRSSGQARVRFRGRDYYLGAWGSNEVEANYTRLVADLAATHGQGRPRAGLASLSDLAGRYLEHSRGYYGAQSREFQKLRSVLGEVLQLFPPEKLANDFSPLDLKAARAAYGAKRDRCRTVVNRFTQQLRRMFKWAAGECLISAETWHALQTVEGLRRGRCDLPEPQPRQPVPRQDVEAALAHLLPPPAAMVSLQRLSGARPGELCILRPMDVDRTSLAHEGCWLYRPAHHKTELQGKSRTIYFGPQAQEVLAPFLLRDADAFCFSPAEAVAELLRRRNEARRVPENVGNAPGRRSGGLTQRRQKPPRDRYTVDSYRRAIERACRRAGVKVWTPHQLRHTRATELWESFSPDVARAVLGHTNLGTTKLYAHADALLARRTMAKVG